MTDYTEPSTIDVDTVVAEINHAYEMRGHLWTDHLTWPHVTAKALADRIAELTAEIERLRSAASEAFSEVLEFDLDRYQELLTEHGRDVGDGVVVFP